MTDPRQLITQLQAAHARANVDDVGSFETLVPRLTALADTLRETYQGSIQNQILLAIGKLERNGTLVPEDIAAIESFMVGDAEAYVRLENDFQSWIAELARLVGVLGEMQSRLEGRVLLDALGEVEDARRVLGDINNFLEEKERVTRFRRTVAEGITPERAAMLIELLRELVASPEI